MADLNDIQLRIIVQGMGLDNLQKISDQLGRAGAAIRTSGTDAVEASSKWKQFGTSLSNMERDFDAVFRAASHLQALGRDLTQIGQAGINFLLGTTKAFGDFQFTLNRAAGALGIFDTLNPMYKELQGRIFDVAREVRVFPAEEIAMAVYHWGAATGQTVKSSQDLKTVTQAIIPIMKMAAVTHTDVEDAIKGVYQILVQYHLPLENAADITEKLQLVSQKTALEMKDLIDAFKYAGAIAPELGVKFEDMAILMGRLGDMGIRGGMSGRALAQMFVKLVDPTAKAKKMLDELFMSTKGLGATFDTLVFPNGKFIGTTKYIDLMAQATENMTDAERGHLLGVITTQNELRALMPLLSDQIRARKGSALAIDQEKFSLADAHVQFEKTFDLLKNSWQGISGLVGNTVSQIGMLIGSTVVQMLTPFMDAFAQMAQAVYNFLNTNPQILEWIVKILAVVSVVTVLAGTLFTALGVILAFGAGIAFVWRGMGQFFQIFDRFLPVLKAFSAGFILIATLLITNFGGIRDAVMNVVDSIIGLLSKLHLNFDLLTVPLKVLSTVLLPIAEKAVQALSGVLNILAGVIRFITGQKAAVDMLSAIGNTALVIAGVFIAWKTITGTLKAVVGAFNLLKGTVLAVGTAIGWMRSLAAFALGIDLVSVATTAWAGATTLAAGAIDLLSVSILGLPIIGWIAAIVIAVTGLYMAWQTNFLGMRQVISDVVNTIFKIFGDFVSWLIGAIKIVFDIAASIPGPWQDAAKGIQGALADAQASVDAWGEETPNKVSETMGKVKTATGDGYAAVRQSVAEHYANMHDMRIADQGDEDASFAYHARAASIQTANLAAIAADQAAQILAAQKSKDQQLKDYAAVVAHYLPDQMQKARDLAKGYTGDMMKSIVDSIYENFDNLDTAWDDYLKHLADPLDAATEMAKIKSRLTSKELREGLISQNPILRADAEAQKKMLEEQLFALQNDVPGIATKTGTDYGTALRNTQVQVAADAAVMLGHARTHMDTLKSDGTGYGSGTGANFRTGLAGQGPGLGTTTSTFLVNAANKLSNFKGSAYGYGLNVGWEFANGISATGSYLNQKISSYLATGSRLLEGGSPPKEGPFHWIDKWGINAGQVFADSLAGQDGYLANKITSYLSVGQKALQAANIGALSDSTFTYEGDSTKRIVIEHEVSSPDGTVNNASQDQLRQIFGGEQMVAALEHMATVG